MLITAKREFEILLFETSNGKAMSVNLCSDLIDKKSRRETRK